MRPAQFLAPLGVAALLAASPLTHAQSPQDRASSMPPATALASALDPAAPQLPLHHTSLPASGAIAQEWADWREANAVVAQFPRGHMDILRWEAEQAAKAQPRPSGHEGHGAHP